MADQEKVVIEKSSGFDIKIIAIGLIFFVLVVGASYLGFYFLARSLVSPLMPQEETETVTSAENIAEGQIVKAGEFTTNVSDVKGSRYLKVIVYVQYAEASAGEESKATMPIIQDTILNILASKTVAELDVSKRDDIKKEIKESLNSKLGADTIQEVYFTDFIIQ